MYTRFTDRARKVMQLASTRAKKRNQSFIDTEHILYGLAEEGSGVAANVLKNLDIDLRKIRSELDRSFSFPIEPLEITGPLSHTPNAKKVIEYAAEEARGLNHNYVGTEHLLLGLLRLEDGLAAQTLINLGLKLAEVREEILNLLGHNLPNYPIPGYNLPNYDIPMSVKPDSDETYHGPDLLFADKLIATVPLTDEQIKLVQVWLERLHNQKENCIAEQDFLKATLLRDKVEVLNKLLAWYNWSQKKN
jgi:hypothetical protein